MEQPFITGTIRYLQVEWRRFTVAAPFRMEK
jgi:hypothetical protein